MSSSVFLTTNWDTRGKAAHSLKQLGKYTSESKITVVQNGGSPKPMDLWLAHESGFEDFDFKNVRTPTSHGKIWNWCMSNAMYEWVVILNDTHFPTDDWDYFFYTLVNKHPHKLYLLDAFNGTEAFAINLPYWQKLGFNNNLVSKKAQIYHLLLRIGFMESIKKKEDLLKTVVFPYADYYQEPLFYTKPNYFLPNENIKELDYMWELSSIKEGIEDFDKVPRTPKQR